MSPLHSALETWTVLAGRSVNQETNGKVCFSILFIQALLYRLHAGTVVKW